MNNLKKVYFISGGFALVGIVMYAIVLGELIVNVATSPTWVSTLKIIGLIAFCIAFVILVTMVIVVTIKEKMEAKKGTVKLSDEELLAKYKSVKIKK